jgi:uncharacterized protein YndB with AHSA1/START domain
MSFIRKEIVINASPDAVWHHLEDPDLLAGWLMRNNFRPEAGADFQFHKQASGAWDGVIDSQLVDFQPPRRMSFTWNANTIGADTLVTIELEAQGEGTLLRLLHTNWEGASGDLDQHARSHSDGWDDHLWVLGKQVEDAFNERMPPAVDWTRFHLYVAIDATPDRIFQAWATSSGMESFFVEMMAIRDNSGRLLALDEPAVAGCQYVWRWDSGALVSGEFIDVLPGHELAFSFGESKVRVRLHPQDGACILELCQYDMEDTEQNRMHLHSNCRAAWVYFLTVLKTLLEHGIDGRDKSRATGASFSTYFDPAQLGIKPCGASASAGARECI